jgi:ligand-binding sensor domain-containing protein
MWISLETDGRDYPSPVAFGIDYYGPDGTFMRNYQPANTNPGAAMRGGQIRGLTVDHRGRFWVGYTGLGVQYFDWPIPAPPAAPDFFTVSGTEDFYIQSLRTYGDSLWVLTDKDLRRYDARSTNPATNSIFSPPGETVQHAVRPLEVGPDGSVWLGTSSGLRIYHPGGRIEDFKVSNSPIASDGVRAIVVDPRSGVAWIGTTAGLNRYDPHYVPPSGAAIQSLHISVRPNPMPLTAIGTPVLLSGGGDVYDGEIYDLNGRVVNRFTQVRDGQAFWNGRDQHGTLVKPGIYFVRATSKGHSATARVAVVR